MSNNVVVFPDWAADIHVYVLQPSDGDAMKLAREESSFKGNQGRVFIEGDKAATKDIGCYICDSRFQKIKVER